MKSPFKSKSEDTPDERAIGSLCERTAAPCEEVRVLFADELDRLALRATVQSYLPLLAAANVYSMLRRREHAQGPPDLNSWEDDGGNPGNPRTPA